MLLKYIYYVIILLLLYCITVIYSAFLDLRMWADVDDRGDQKYLTVQLSLHNSCKHWSALWAMVSLRLPLAAAAGECRVCCELTSDCCQAMVSAGTQQPKEQRTASLTIHQLQLAAAVAVSESAPCNSLQECCLSIVIIPGHL